MLFVSITRLLMISIFLSGHLFLVGFKVSDRSNLQKVKEPVISTNSNWDKKYEQDVKPILEKRCVVCHGCYDSPCQLNLTSVEGINRGASKELVYNAYRLLQAPPSRLSFDETSIAGWRKRKFYPVLNEGKKSKTANKESSLLYRMLELKKKHPLPKKKLLPSSFTLGIHRKQRCPTINEFERFSTRYPLWGMPYGLPGLTTNEFNKITEWVLAGSPFPKAIELPKSYLARIKTWEDFFNQVSLKGKLVSRYIYEHLYFAHLYFDDLPTDYFFQLVRSYTPPGQPIKIISTRRPYDDPGSQKFYYRLRVVDTTLLAKTHMPYKIGKKRMEKWRQWFFKVPYDVTRLPSYKPEIASNPFITFVELPVASRYRFMLEEAEYTLMGFIKGPVCRGQIALHVIRDRFWVFFVNPEISERSGSARFLAGQKSHLRLPAEAGSTIVPLGQWLSYASKQKKYLKAKYQEGSRILRKRDFNLNMDLIWDGDGVNPNAALTIFRHFDNATVVKGLLGEFPQTAWIIDYPILERIHYLLVPGFDVFGNSGHQLLTRLYMDFLRMESEFNFLAFLPESSREKEWDDWYEGAGDDVKRYVREIDKFFYHKTDIIFTADNPKKELYKLLIQKLEPVLDKHRSLSSGQTLLEHKRWLKLLSSIRGKPATFLPQTNYLIIEENRGQTHLYTVLHNSAHSNITSLFRPDSTRRPEQDSVTVVKGIIGAYPGAFWVINENQLPALVADVKALHTEEGYRRFMDRYGIRRTDMRFWKYSDKLHQRYREVNPVRFGFLDYNRLENR